MQGSKEQAHPETKGHKAGLAFVKAADRAVRIAVDVVFIIILLIALWFIVDTIYVYYNARAGTTMPYKPTDGTTAVLQELSEDAIGWITIDDTTIDYPVMQGKDNYEYLNKDPYGNHSLSGSIYLDSRDASDFSDPYSILYGHHMSGGFMFGALDDFEDKSYFESHLTGTLTTKRGELPVSVEAFMYTDASNDLVFDADSSEAELEQFIKSNANNYNGAVPLDGKLIALSTCRSPTSTRRMILFVRTVEQ